MDQDIEQIRREALKAKAMYIYEAHLKNNQYGGAEKKEREPAPFTLEVGCVEVHQEKKAMEGKQTINFDAKICKSPPLRIYLREQVVGWHKIIKVALNHVNGNLRTKEVKKIEVKMGKKKLTIDGDKLATETIDVLEIKSIDDIKVTM